MKLVYTESELPQGSDEWKEWRKQGIGASSVACLMFESPYESIEMAWEYRVGERPPKDWSEIMRRGNELEPKARECYEKNYGKVEPLCVVHPDHPWMRASLDGVRLDRSAIIEIKCPKDLANHKRQTSGGKVPRHRRAQLQHQLAIAYELWGIELAHYWSYVDDDNCKLITLEYNREYARELIRRERIFLGYVERNERPPFNLFREGKGLKLKPEVY